MLISRPSVLPDWLHKHAPYAGAPVVEAMTEEDYEAEIRWLESCTRMLESGETTAELRHLCKPPTTYRQATSWYLIAIDTMLHLKTQRGFEAFASEDTVEKCLEDQGANAPYGDRERLLRVCKNLYGYEFLGIHMDTCSVGTCGANYAKWARGLYVEPVFDGLHGIHRAIFRALDLGDLWHIFLTLRLLYTFAWAPWLGGKYIVE